MNEAKDVLRIIGIILLGIFVLVVGIPLVLAAAGITLGIIGFLFKLAVMVIKVAVIVAIGYLILVGIRAMLRCVFTVYIEPQIRHPCKKFI